MNVDWRTLTEAQPNLIDTREQASLVFAEAQKCCLTQENEPHWFSHVKQT